MYHIVREATERELHPYNMNRDAACCLSKSWEPHICQLKNFWDITSDPLPYTGHTLLIALALGLLKTLPPRLLVP
jgi:hypothetical protein